jgi:hypothetical protein
LNSEEEKDWGSSQDKYEADFIDDGKDDVKAAKLKL